jgi:hypothetical protein
MALTLIDVQAEGLLIREPFSVQANIPVEKTVRGRKIMVTETVNVSLAEAGEGDNVSFFKNADRSHLQKVKAMAESKHLTLMFREQSPAQKESGIFQASFVKAGA